MSVRLNNNKYLKLRIFGLGIQFINSNLTRINVRLCSIVWSFRLFKKI